MLRAARNARMDLRYGGWLGGATKTRFADRGAFDTMNSAYEYMPSVFGAADVRPDDVVVDVGCGKGRVLNWLLAHHPSCRLVGIELDPEICARTARRLRRYANVEIRCGDATELLPADGTLFYLFNPFDEAVLRRFADALLALPPHPRRRVLYYRSKFLHVFADDPRFAVEELDLPAGAHRSALVRPA